MSLVQESTRSGRSSSRKGGTLILAGATGIDHLDTACASYTASRQVQRTFARQLFSYPASANWHLANVAVPDVAREIPTRFNGGVSADGLTYTIRLRDGVMWDTVPPRPVTASDFVRGFKRLANPIATAGGISYYTSTILGMAEYAESYAEAFKSGTFTAADLAEFQRTHSIAGIVAKDAQTLVIRLHRPAGDLVNILALGYASAAPVEYDAFLPDSRELERNLISNGPYKLTRYQANLEIQLDHNPAWRQESDPIRHQYVDRIIIRQDVNDPDEVLRRIEAGEADLPFALPVPKEHYQRLMDDPKFQIYPAYIINPYLVFNFIGPNEAMRCTAVRQAIQYAVDKVAINEVYGTPEMNNPLHTVIPSGNIGHVDYNLYPTPGDRGDPARAKALLASAGYDDNQLVIRLAYRDAGFHPAIARSFEKDLTRCGIKVRLLSVEQGDFYSRFLSDPAKTRSGLWDMAIAGFIPDWYGNNGRAVVQPLFQTNERPGTLNFGGYSNPELDRLINRALEESDPSRAQDLWHQADMRVMSDSAIVPTQSHGTPRYHGARVENACFVPHTQWFDLTNIWLTPPAGH